MRTLNYIPLTTLVASIVIAVVLSQLFPVSRIFIFPYNLLGLLLVGTGLYLSYQSVMLLKAHKTTIKPGENPSSLVIGCPYHYSRNPIYLGDIMLITGIAIILSDVTALLSPIIFFLVINSVVIPHEEKNLTRNFGHDYERYKKEVRRWI